MNNICPVHDQWRFERSCNCSPERLWARKNMLQQNLEEIAALGQRKTKPSKNALES